MNDLKNNVNLPLLYEVRIDAFTKSRDVAQGERLFSMIHHMDLLARTAGREGLLALEEAAKEIPTEIGFSREQTLKRVICDVTDTAMEISLKGLSVNARKKIFSAISDYKADEYARNCEYMGPVRQIDVMAAMSELIAVFEKTCKKNCFYT